MDFCCSFCWPCVARVRVASRFRSFSPCGVTVLLWHLSSLHGSGLGLIRKSADDAAVQTASQHPGPSYRNAGLMA